MRRIAVKKRLLAYRWSILDRNFKEDIRFYLGAGSVDKYNQYLKADINRKWYLNSISND